MRRKNGDGLVSNEELVLVAALRLHNDGDTQFHGYRLNSFLDEHNKKLVASTLYRILKRLEERGFMESHWEQHPQTEQWRCMFTLTGQGVSVAQEVSAKPTNQALSLLWNT